MDINEGLPKQPNAPPHPTPLDTQRHGYMHQSNDEFHAIVIIYKHFVIQLQKVLFII